MKVIFMGSPAFAVPTLKALIDSQDHEVVAVYTNPPRASGRNYMIRNTAVHQLAEENGIKIYTPQKLTTPDAIEQFNAIDADVVVVAAYGKILRKPILEGKKYGCLNIHPSKLPRWRGAAPIQHTIIEGDSESAVCIMQMDEGLDTGDIILQEDFDIPTTMTSKELHDFTSDLGAKLLLKTLDLLKSGDAIKTKQVGESKYADKLSPRIEKIDWNMSADRISCLIRGLSPIPGAYFVYNGTKIKIVTAQFLMPEDDAYSGIADNNSEPGTILGSKNQLIIKCGTGVLIPELVQREGKKMIYTKAFLRGFELKQGFML